MNKLVSKNPVQRFKQGKRILKAYYGNGMNLPYNADNEEVPVVKPIMVNGITLAEKRKQYQNKNQSSVPNSVSKPNTVAKKPTTFKGISASGKVLARKNQWNDVISNEDKQKLMSTGYFNRDSFKDVKTFQQALNNYLGKDGYGSISEDNMWGNQTAAAFKTALDKSTSPVVRTVDKVIFQGKQPSLVSVPTVKAENINIPIKDYGYSTTNHYDGDLNKYIGTLKSLNINSNQSLADFVNRDNSDLSGWEAQLHNDIRNALNNDYSDENIKRVFGTSGKWGKGFLGRGDYGDFFNSLQRLAGTWNGNYYRNVMNKTPINKQGGQLVSRNPITRFKNKKK